MYLRNTIEQQRSTKEIEVKVHTQPKEEQWQLKHNTSKQLI